MEIKIISGQPQGLRDVLTQMSSLGGGIEFVTGSGYLWYDKDGDGSLEALGNDGINNGGAGDDERIPFDNAANAALVANNGQPMTLSLISMPLRPPLDWANGGELPGVGSTAVPLPP